MSNFGFSEMRLVNPYQVAFREAKSAVKSQHVLRDAKEYGSLAEAVADCALVVGTTSRGPRALEHPLRRLEQGGRAIAKRLAMAPVALLFGSEKFGLSNEDLSHCHWLLRIPTREEHGSMNLGQAVAVCLYEIIRKPPQSLAKPPEKPPGESGGSGADHAAAGRGPGRLRVRSRAGGGLDQAEAAAAGAADGSESARRCGVARDVAATSMEVGSWYPEN